MYAPTYPCLFQRISFLKVWKWLVLQFLFVWQNTSVLHDREVDDNVMHVASSPDPALISPPRHAHDGLAMTLSGV